MECCLVNGLDILANTLVDTTLEWRKVQNIIDDGFGEIFNFYEASLFIKCVQIIRENAGADGQPINDLLLTDLYLNY